VGGTAACDYAFATVDSSIKLSELYRVGPFVIEPTVSRKIGKSAMSEMTLAAHEWKNTDGPSKKDFMQSTADQVELDIDLAISLASYNRKP
jgi:methylglutaconyl-CoA hydratase